MNAGRDGRGIPAAFVVRLRAHNRHATGLALLCGSAALVLWALAYVCAWWLALLALSAWVGVEAELPRRFAHGCAGLAVLSLALASLRRGRPALDGTPGWRSGLADLALAPARLLWAGIDNLRAVAPLPPHALAAAWEIASAVREAERMPLRSLPVVVSDDALRDRALRVLQLAGLITLRPGADGWYAMLADAESRHVCEPRVRLGG